MSDESTGTGVDARAIGGGAAVQTVHVAALYAVAPLAGSGLGSLFLVLATGLMGGVVAGDRAGGPPRRSALHGLGSGLVGGAVFALVFWTLMVTPGAPRGAFAALARLTATHPPPGAASHPDLVTGLLAVGSGVAIAVLAALAGWRAPSRPDHVVVEKT